MSPAQRLGWTTKPGMPEEDLEETQGFVMPPRALGRAVSPGVLPALTKLRVIRSWFTLAAEFSIGASGMPAMGGQRAEWGHCLDPRTFPF